MPLAPELLLGDALFIRALRTEAAPDRPRTVPSCATGSRRGASLRRPGGEASFFLAFAGEFPPGWEGESEGDHVELQNGTVLRGRGPR